MLPVLVDQREDMLIARVGIRGADKGVYSLLNQRFENILHDQVALRHLFDHRMKDEKSKAVKPLANVECLSDF